MADKFINLTDLGTIRTWILSKIGLKLDKTGDVVDEFYLETENSGVSILDSSNLGHGIQLVSEHGDIEIISGGGEGVISGLASPVNDVDAANKAYVDDTLDDKQDKLVSGTNIKTINNASLLGGGNIDTTEVFIAKVGTTSAAEIIAAYEANKIIVVVPSGIHTTYSFVVSNVNKSSATSCQIAGSYLNAMTLSNGLLVVKYNISGTTWTFSSETMQPRLVSGTNIKTVNNQSLLGSGNIDIQGGGSSDVFVATFNVTPVQDVIDAWEANKVIYLDDGYLYLVTNVFEQDIGTSDFQGGISFIGGAIEERLPWYGWCSFIYDETTGTYSWDSYSTYELASNDDLIDRYATKIYVDNAVPKQATDTTTGTIKLNPNQNITLNANGQLEVGGRIGQFEGTTGLFAPNNRAPRNVLDYSFLMTDALGVDMSANRSMAVVSGYGLTCKSAAAGSTEYRVSNTYANRIIAKLCEGGYASRDEATSKAEQIIPVVSVRIGGSSYTPDSSANDSSTAGDIVITTSETLNPSGAITNIRLFGKMQSYASLHLGNGIKSESGGRSVILGGAVTKVGSTNDNCLIGNAIYSSGNGNAAFGRNHICRKNRGFFAGTGHDSTNARTEGASAVGEYSYMDSNTMFAVGNGTSHTARSNAFEVTSDGGIVLKSPGGTRYKITVDNSGNLTPTAL